MTKDEEISALRAALEPFIEPGIEDCCDECGGDLDECPPHCAVRIGREVRAAIREQQGAASQPSESLSDDLPEVGILIKRIRLVADDIAFFGFDSALVLNCGDTFAYACADAEEVPDDQIDTVRRLHDKHGYPGLVAWIARRRGCEPLAQLRTEAYLAALADIDSHAVQTEEDRMRAYADKCDAEQQKEPQS